MKVLKATIKLKQQKTQTSLLQQNLESKIQKTYKWPLIHKEANNKKNMEIIQVISFIEEIMQKLKTFGKKFKVQLDLNLTQ